MKKLALAAVLSIGALSSTWAAPATTSMTMMDKSQPQTMMEMGQNRTHCQSIAATQSSAQPFSQLNEHEKAATALEFTPNGQSGPQHRAAQRHLAMMAG